MRNKRPQLLFATCGLAAALTAACGNKDQNRADQPMADADRPVGTSGSTATMNDKKPVDKPVDLTGCLQKSDGSYVLTEINKPSPNAAPTKKKGDGSVAEREQLHAAQHAYRLSGDKDDELEKLVGKQVRVSGTMTEPSDLIDRDNRKGNDLNVGTSGVQDKNHEGRQDRAKIDTGNLAKVDVTSIQQVAEGCGKK
jgi:hypothetical protein